MYLNLGLKIAKKCCRQRKRKDILRREEHVQKHAVTSKGFSFGLLRRVYGILNDFMVLFQLLEVLTNAGMVLSLLLL